MVQPERWDHHRLARSEHQPEATPTAAVVSMATVPVPVSAVGVVAIPGDGGVVVQGGRGAVGEVQVQVCCCAADPGGA